MGAVGLPDELRRFWAAGRLAGALPANDAIGLWQKAASSFTLGCRLPIRAAKRRI